MSHFRRLGVLITSGALTLTGLTLAGGPAQAATADPRPVSIGATWLEGQLTNGLLHYPDTGFGEYDDYGLSIDAGLSLASVGGHSTAVTAVRTAIATAVSGGHYITGEDFGDTGSTYAGAVAKAAVFAKASGGNPTSFGGVNLITRLEAQVSTTAPNAGRLFDTSSFGDNANTLGQAFAANALSAAGSAEAPSVVDFLLKQQCAAGFFRLTFSAKVAPDQSCDAAATATPDTDATAMALLQLATIPSPSATLTTHLHNAEAWLLATQHADGSFGGGTSTEAPNTNSTGLAGWALGALGDTAAATRAATWVRSHQADEPTSCPNALSGQTGALAYDDAALAAGRTDGITTAVLDQWRRSTAPTLPVLKWAPAATAPFDLNGPTGYVQAGSSVTLQVSGAAPGAKVCVSGIGSARAVVAPASGAFPVTLAVPAGTANRLVVASQRSGDSAGVQVRALDAKTLRVRPGRSTVHRGARLRVVVRGLAPAERVVLSLRGVTVRKGHADPKGVFVRTFRVGHKLGKARIVAAGAFPGIRHGRAVIRVVR